MKLRTWEVVFALVCIAASIGSLVLAEIRPGGMSEQSAFWMSVLFIGFAVLPFAVLIGWRVGRIIGQAVGSHGR